MQSEQNVAKSFLEETVTDCSLDSAQDPQNQLRVGVGGLGRPTGLAEEPGVPWKDTKAVATSPGSNLNPSPRRWALGSITGSETSHLMLACSSAEIEERAPGKASLTSSSGVAEPHVITQHRAGLHLPVFSLSLPLRGEVRKPGRANPRSASATPAPPRAVGAGSSAPRAGSMAASREAVCGELGWFVSERQPAEEAEAEEASPLLGGVSLAPLASRSRASGFPRAELRRPREGDGGRAGCGRGRRRFRIQRHPRVCAPAGRRGGRGERSRARR